MRPEVGRGPADVADQALVGHPALGPGRGRGVVGAGPGGLAGVQVGADGQVAVGGEPPGDLLGRLVVAGHVVDHHHPTGRRPVERLGQVGLDLVAAVAGDRDRLRPHRIAAVECAAPVSSVVAPSGFG